LNSAVANATQKEGVSASDLYISKIEVNGGIIFTRYMPRARGRASEIQKKTSHITLALSKKAPKGTYEVPGPRRSKPKSHV
jgi:large subunit ribosomal protein L22